MAAKTQKTGNGSAKKSRKRGVWIKAHKRKSLPPRAKNGRFRRKRQTSLF